MALNQVATERGVSVEVIVDTVKNAILAAFRKDHPSIELEEYTVTLDPNSGEARVFHGEEDVTPPGFGRIAAQTAKQVILQKVREKEKEAILEEYRKKIGTIQTGLVLRFAGHNVIVDIGKTEALMPPPEQISNEQYRVNQRLQVYIEGIREGMKGEEIIVSRASTGLLAGLFKREVPEIAQGTVIIKEIAREAGARTKIAVAAMQSGIDPVGSCVGQKGVRVQAIIQEFGGMEKIDISECDPDMKRFLAQALAPAKDITVILDEDRKTARVIVSDDQLSLVIGKEGQNVRLASKLTGYRIEVEGKGKPAPVEEPEEEVIKGTEGTEETDGTKETSAAAEAMADKEETKEKIEKPEGKVEEPKKVNKTKEKKKEKS